MKVAFISDIHVDSLPEPSHIVDAIRNRLLTIGPDVFIIAGDVAARTKLFEQTLRAFSELPCEKLLVPGNHDIWVETTSLEMGIHSGNKHTEIIPQICSRNNFIALGQDPYTMDGIAAKSSTIGFKNALRRFPANSLIKRALPTPKGTQINTAPKVTQKDPNINGRIPKSGGS